VRGPSQFTEALLEQALADSKLSQLDRRLCHELVLGIVRWQATLDWLVARKAPGRTQKPGLQDLLRLGLYQIFWLDRIPGHAAVHETVEQAKQGGFGPQAGFVNAVLRGYLREFDATKKLLVELKSTQPAIGWSHPEWLVARWQSRWGAAKTQALLAWNNTPSKTFARLNTLRTDAGKLIEKWRAENVDYDFVTTDWTEESLVFELKSHPPLAMLESFRQGWFYVQDPSTLLAVPELDPQPGEAILDLCAAPGGKTTFIAQLLRNEGRIVAQDLSVERLKLVQENCTRLGVTCVEVRSPESGVQSPKTQFDKVLVDAPCSNTGVMRRRADLRWRIRPEEIERLRLAQLDLVRQAALALRPGGKLVYSTCSLEPEENAGVIELFLNEHSNFKIDGARELTPFADNVDGAYICSLIRI
jgi:16S rRNA (cytosine967-C5)-methyltransferase